ncbi:MAG: cation-translocating P-type ATPase [Bacteroidales bacterium]|nr:cation-translocating P-type ATPase [Bacteroidales bacterium]
MDINQNFPYHSIYADDAINRLKSDKNGLDHDERQKRLQEFGENKLEEKGKTSILSLIIKQFKDFLVYVLLAAALISYFAGHSIDFWVIIGVILVNATIGFFKNKWLILAFFVSIVLQLAAIKLPFMQEIFKFRDLPWTDIPVITLLSSLVFVFGELYKFIRSRVVKN